jgi:ribosomal protein L22
MEKDYNAKQRENQAMKKQQNVGKKTEIVGAKVENKKEDEKIEEKKLENEEATIEEKADSKKEESEKKKEKKQIQKIKREEATVNGISLPISTKDSVAICKFIKRKSIDKAISDLEEVEKFKKAIPMTGEIPHRKGKGMMSGRYMTKPVGYFIQMLKSLKANSNMNGIEEPIIVEAVPNRAARPYGRFGRVKRKRTHIKIKVIEKKKLIEKSKLKNKKHKRKKNK